MFGFCSQWLGISWWNNWDNGRSEEIEYAICQNSKICQFDGVDSSDHKWTVISWMIGIFPNGSHRSLPQAQKAILTQFPDRIHGDWNTKTQFITGLISFHEFFENVDFFLNIH